MNLEKKICCFEFSIRTNFNLKNTDVICAENQFKHVTVETDNFSITQHSLK